MSEQVVTVIISVFGGALASIAVQRWGKTRQERKDEQAKNDAGVATDYLKLADMTAERLEKMELQGEKQRLEISNLSARITKLQIELGEKDRELAIFKRAFAEKIEAFQKYVKELTDIMEANNIKAPTMPHRLTGDTIDQIKRIQFPIKPGSE